MNLAHTLQDVRDTPIEIVPLGLQKRIELARALVSEPLSAALARQHNDANAIAGTVGPVPRPSQFVACELFGAERRCGGQAFTVARGRKRLDPQGGQHRGGNGGRLWRGRLYLPVALPSAGGGAGMFSGAGQLGRGRCASGDGHPRGRVDHWERSAVRAACDRGVGRRFGCSLLRHPREGGDPLALK